MSAVLSWVRRDLLFRFRVLTHSLKPVPSRRRSFSASCLAVPFVRNFSGLVLRRGGRIGAGFGGVDADAHTVQLAATFLGFRGLRIALHQGPQFTDAGVFLAHFNERLSLAQFSGGVLLVAGILFHESAATLVDPGVISLHVVDLPPR